MNNQKCAQSMAFKGGRRRRRRRRQQSHTHWNTSMSKNTQRINKDIVVNCNCDGCRGPPARGEMGVMGIVMDGLGVRLWMLCRGSVACGDSVCELSGSDALEEVGVAVGPSAAVTKFPNAGTEFHGTPVAHPALPGHGGTEEARGGDTHITHVTHIIRTLCI